MNIEVLQQLHCPGGGPALTPATVARAHDGDILTGSVHCPRGGLFAITDGILNLRPENVGPMSPTQRSNLPALSAALYEPLWRVRSLSLLTGRTFPVSQELGLMLDAVGKPRAGLWLDLGASTGLYGRTLARHVAGAGGQIIMLDLSMAMLRRARRYTDGADVSNVAFVCGRAERLPFDDGQLRGLVCGGTLNEFGPHGVEAALRESARVLAPDAPSFWMYVLRSEGTGALLQDLLTRTGLLFWQRAESEALFTRAGLRVTAFHRVGVVAFARAVPA